MPNLCNMHYIAYLLGKVWRKYNGTHFTDEQLDTWLRNLNVHHILAAPWHPKSNGLTENFVKTIKSAIPAVEIKML